MNIEHIMKNNLIFQYLLVDEQVSKRGKIFNQYEDRHVDRCSVYQEMAEISRKSFEKYADVIGCQYQFSTEKWLTEGHNNSVSTLFEALRIIYDPYFDQFDDILFVDCDIVVNTKNNIFEQRPKDAEILGVLESDVIIDRQDYSLGNNDQMKGGYNSWDWCIDNKAWFSEKWRMHDCPIVPTVGYNTKRNSCIFMFNTGVLIWTKEARLKARKLFDPWQQWLHPKIKDIKNVIHHMSILNDQPFISAMVQKYEFNVATIDQRWNDTPVHYPDPQEWIEGTGDKECWFLHFTGGDHKITMIKWYHEKRFPVFNEDW